MAMVRTTHLQKTGSQNRLCRCPLPPTPLLLPWSNHRGTSARPETASASQQIALRQQLLWALGSNQMWRNRGRSGGWVAARPRPAPPLPPPPFHLIPSLQVPQECGLAIPGRGSAWPGPRDRRRGSADLGSIAESCFSLSFPCPVCAARPTRLPPRDGREATVAAHRSALQFWTLVSHGPLGS